MSSLPEKAGAFDLVGGEGSTPLLTCALELVQRTVEGSVISAVAGKICH
jgi:hypothetical protein